jgi:gluconate 2-dehydrogenase gamma chain
MPHPSPFGAPEHLGAGVRLDRRGVIAGAAVLAASGLGLPVAVLAQDARRPPRFFLIPEEERALTAMVDRILPADGWPSASEAGVVDYIDFQLATAWGQGEGLFRQGPHQGGTAQQGYQLPHTPAELYRAALGDPALRALAEAPAAAVDAMLTRLQKNEHRPGDVPGGAFFTYLRQNTLEGYFADPVHNGNAGLAGWRMIGFPGAHAYYLTEVDRFELDYRRPPSGIGHRPGLGEPPPLRTGLQREAR